MASSPYCTTWCWSDGTIVDFYVQDTTAKNHEPDVVILACRSAEFRATLEEFARPAAPLVREIDGAAARQFFVDYWILTHKQAKAMARKYDEFAFAGLYLERLSLLRALYMVVTGNDIDSRPTLHMIGAMHKGLEGKLTAAAVQHTWPTLDDTGRNRCRHRGHPGRDGPCRPPAGRPARVRVSVRAGRGRTANLARAQERYHKEVTVR